LPPARTENILRRSREYLTPAEVKNLRAAAKNTSERHGLRDQLLVVMAYRHALRVSELCDLKWDQVHFSDGKHYVARLKNGDPSVHYLEGDEVRMLRKLQRDYPDSPYLFVSQKAGPLSIRTVHDNIARAGEFAGIDFPVHPHILRHAKEPATSSGSTIQPAVSIEKNPNGTLVSLGLTCGKSYWAQVFQLFQDVGHNHDKRRQVVQSPRCRFFPSCKI
jgi:integrase